MTTRPLTDKERAALELEVRESNAEALAVARIARLVSACPSDMCARELLGCAIDDWRKSRAKLREVAEGKR